MIRSFKNAPAVIQTAQVKTDFRMHGSVALRSISEKTGYL